ncbi:MAG: pantoate--beta-alanine ligase [Blastopirellula sp.]|nr:MAG: pantoate--beta-alanine ligase [Blastopirellula sp.]
MNPQRPQLVHDLNQIRDIVRKAQSAGKKVGLVPTMGALHQGHLSLVEQSASQCDLTVVTIFVNPTQFAQDEDLAKYPRTLESDLELLSQFSPVIVLAPEAADVYPAGSSTAVQPPDVGRLWEGEKRPDHFAGVATIVLKLFNMVPAEIAFFGQKDYQQACVIQQMVKDLNVPMEIQVCPIVREPDGLAMSSRNRYLSQSERKTATVISQTLEIAEQMMREGETETQVILDQCMQELTAAHVDSIDYVTIADPITLELVQTIAGPVVILIAVYVGKTRLIDNRVIQL